MPHPNSNILPNCFPVATLAGMLAMVASIHCVETTEYPQTTYRNATDLQFQVAASYDNFDEYAIPG